MAQAADVNYTHSPVAGSAARRPAARGWSCKWRQLFESLFLFAPRTPTREGPKRCGGPDVQWKKV